MSIFRDIRNAFAFMSVIPFPVSSNWDEKDAGRAALFFPLVGWSIGALSGAAYPLFLNCFSKTLSAVLTLILWILLSGGLHWDGLADCADSFAYPGTPERRREIMKDPRNGTFGTLSLICGLLLKFSLIEAASETNSFWVFGAVGALSRWATLFLLRFPSANPKGMAAALRPGFRKGTELLSLPLVLISLAFCGVSSFLLIPFSLLVVFGVGKLACEKIEGITGDVFGMSIEIIELFLLLITEGAKWTF